MTPLVRGTVLRRFDPPRSTYEYGFDARGAIVQEGSPSGFLLPNEAIDDHADSIVKSRPPMYCVTGEYVRDDGMRFPMLAMTPEYMRWTGHVRDEHGRWRKGER